MTAKQSAMQDIEEDHEFILDESDTIIETETTPLG